MIFYCQCGWKIVTQDGLDRLNVVCNNCQSPLSIIDGEMILSNNNDKNNSVNNNKNRLLDILRKTNDGRDHWLKLHSYAVIHKNNWALEPVKEFYNNWEQTIPNISCGCRKNWFELKKTISLDKMFDSPESFFRWSVEAHNAVNKKLNKTIVSYEEACQIHGF